MECGRPVRQLEAHLSRMAVAWGPVTHAAAVTTCAAGKSYQIGVFRTACAATTVSPDSAAGSGSLGR